MSHRDYSNLPKLKHSDLPALRAIVQQCDSQLIGCGMNDISAMIATLMLGYSNHGITDKQTLDAKKNLSAQVLSEVPSWLLSNATIEAIKATATDLNPRARAFMPSDAMILAQAMPIINKIRAQRRTALMLIDRQQESVN